MKNVKNTQTTINKGGLYSSKTSKLAVKPTWELVSVTKDEVTLSLGKQNKTLTVEAFNKNWVMVEANQNNTHLTVEHTLVRKYVVQLNAEGKIELLQNGEVKEVRDVKDATFKFRGYTYPANETAKVEYTHTAVYDVEDEGTEAVFYADGKKANSRKISEKDGKRSFRFGGVKYQIEA